METYGNKKHDHLAQRDKVRRTTNARDPSEGTGVPTPVIDMVGDRAAYERADDQSGNDSPPPHAGHPSN